ncbi:MAG: TIR domain-containing protein [Candidatus Sabulitectum sp.]|nr:TIR domain-containing protein [Candidatus Sabulitectum sp.]
MHIFISHSSRNTEEVHRLVKSLEREGLKYWIASRDIKPGDSWATSIMNAIESSSVMLLLLSESANSSQQVSREIEEAVRLNIPILPVIMGSFEISKGLMYFINSHQWIDAYHKNDSEWISAAVSTLKRYSSSNAPITKIADSEKVNIINVSPPVLRGKKKISRNRTNHTFFYIIGIVLFFLTGYFMLWKPYVKQLVSPISRYDHAVQLMEEGKFNKAFIEFQEFVDDFPENSFAPSALYYSAKMAENIGSQSCGNIYRSVAETYPQSLIAEISLSKSAIAYELNGMPSEALQIHSIIARDSAYPIPLRIPSLCKYADYLYEATAFKSAEEFYIECIEIYDSLRYEFEDHYFPRYIESEAFRAYPARSSYRLALIGISELNSFTEITPENVSDYAQKKGSVESWLGKCLTYNMNEYFIASCGLASDLYISFADRVFSMDPPPGLDEAVFDEFYNHLNIQFYEPEIQKAVNIAVTAIEYSLRDGVISVSEKELIIRLASCVDELSPGSTTELGIPDSIYSFYVQNRLQFELEASAFLVSSSLAEATIDGVITSFEAERIVYYASALDELSPGATDELGIPDSIYAYRTDPRADY